WSPIYATPAFGCRSSPRPESARLTTAANTSGRVRTRSAWAARYGWRLTGATPLDRCAGCRSGDSFDAWRLMSETHEALGRDLVAAAVLRGDFLLRSGARSSYYIDKYLFTTEPALLQRLARALSSRLPDGVQRVAGPVLGAVPLVTAVSLETGLPSLIVRVDEPKEYGTSRRFEGKLAAGDRVVLVEDVVTTGV